MRLARLLEMILSMTRLDSHVPFDRQPTDINALASRAFSRVSQKMEEKALSEVFDPDPSLPLLLVDVDWLSEALEHILGNAIEFTPEGGTISIKTYREAPYTVIEIRDTGIGIQEEALPHIFERFWRLDEAHSTPGFGLGLPIAQQVVARHGGSIEVESTPGRGSRFEVWLPIVDAE